MINTLLQLTNIKNRKRNKTNIFNHSKILIYISFYRPIGYIVVYRTLRNFPFHHSFFFNDTATTEIYTLSLHDALPISLLGNNFWKIVCNFHIHRLNNSFIYSNADQRRDHTLGCRFHILRPVRIGPIIITLEYQVTVLTDEQAVKTGQLLRRTVGGSVVDLPGREARSCPSNRIRRPRKIHGQQNSQAEKKTTYSRKRKSWLHVS